MVELDAVIFDMDGVLCRLDDEARVAHLASVTGLEPDAIVQAIWGSGFEDRADQGEYSAADYLTEFGSRLGRPFSREEWVAYRRSGMTPVVAVLDLARSVSERAQVAVLTNNGLLLLEEVDSLFPELRPIFGDRVWSSALFGARKPSAEAFLEACRRLGSSPERTMMIDDSRENALGARRAGLLAHRYFDPEACFKVLDDLAG